MNYLLLAGHIANLAGSFASVIKYKDIDVKKVLNTRTYDVGYEVRTEEWQFGNSSEDVTTVKSAYTTPKGEYIGDPKLAYWLIVKRGIMPEKASSTDNVCTIGFCEKDQKWFGWSHRALYGFGVGHKVKKGSTLVGDGYKVGDTVETLDEARDMAIAFAKSVS
jgi:hypothetical protein